MCAAHGWRGGDDEGRPEADAGLIAFSGRDGDGGLRSSPATSAGSAGRRSLVSGSADCLAVSVTDSDGRFAGGGATSAAWGVGGVRVLCAWAP